MKDKFIKLTNTAYKALEFFPEADPLKNRAKDKVLAIMSALGGSRPDADQPRAGAFGGENSGDWLAAGEIFSTEREKKKIQLLEDIDVLLGYFWIGKSQGWLSAINCLILSNEYENIKKEISPIQELTQKLPGLNLPPTNFLDKKLVGDKVSASAIFNLSERQAKILDFLDKNEKAQVMDLQKILPNVTKRTIRRDLDELLKAGKIQRLGEFNQVVYKIIKS